MWQKDGDTGVPTLVTQDQDPEDCRMTKKKPISRRELLHLAAGTGGLLLAGPLLAACARPVEEAATEVVIPTGTRRVGGQEARTASAAVEEAEVSASPEPTAMAQASQASARPSPAQADALEPTATPEASASGGSSVTKIAFVKTSDRAEGVRTALELLAFNAFGDKQVVLKPNFNSADPPPGSTHDDVLRTLVRQLHAMGADTITVVDRSGMGNTRDVMESKGVFEMGEELGFETVVLDELPPSEWEMMQPKGSHWTRGFPFPRFCLEAEAIVQTCCLKTHQYGGHFTMSLKNSVGMVASHLDGGHDFMNELHQSRDQRRMIAEINFAYEPALVVMDGVDAFVSGGPARGKVVSPGVVVAGTDRVAIDAIGVALLRHFGTTPEVSKGPVFQQEQIARAVELGLGVKEAGKIEWLTPDEESEAYAAQIAGLLTGV